MIDSLSLCHITAVERRPPLRIESATTVSPLFLISGNDRPACGRTPGVSVGLPISREVSSSSLRLRISESPLYLVSSRD